MTQSVEDQIDAGVDPHKSVADTLMTKEQIAVEKRLAKEAEKQKKATDKLVKFYQTKQNKVYATGNINQLTTSGVEHHKFNTLKDAENNFTSYEQEAMPVIVEYTVSRIIRPIPTGKGKKKQYETIA